MPPLTGLLPSALMKPAMMSLGRRAGAPCPLPSATRMSPLGRTSVWRGIARSVAMGVIV
ncbi:hypothetical protein ACFSYD_26470 [Paracoccus aerius]